MTEREHGPGQDDDDRGLDTDACRHRLHAADVSYDPRLASMAVQANAAMGIPADAVLPIGIVGLVCKLLYVFPPTAALGAILLTGFLGEAIVTHLRVHGSLHDMGENVLIGVIAWGGLWLRDARIRRI